VHSPSPATEGWRSHGTYQSAYGIAARWATPALEGTRPAGERVPSEATHGGTSGSRPASTSRLVVSGLAHAAGSTVRQHDSNVDARPVSQPTSQAHLRLVCRPSAFQANRSERCADLRKRTSLTSETALGGRCRVTIAGEFHQARGRPVSAQQTRSCCTTASPLAHRYPTTCWPRSWTTWRCRCFAPGSPQSLPWAWTAASCPRRA